MKFKILILVVLFSIKGHCQFNDMYKMLSKSLTEKNEKNYKVYKVKGKIYETDDKTFFASEKVRIFENKSDDDIDFKIYKKRFLFINYYQKHEPDRLISSIPRPIKKIDVIDLEEISKRWSYDFRNLPRTYIKSFDPKSGDIIYVLRLKPQRKPEPELEKDIIK